MDEIGVSEKEGVKDHFKLFGSSKWKDGITISLEGENYQ